MEMMPKPEKVMMRFTPFFKNRDRFQLIGGFVGGSVDALSTYAIAQAAKALFLGDMIDFERQEKLEINRMRVLMNMALVDGIYGEDEKNIFLTLIF